MTLKTLKLKNNTVKELMTLKDIKVENKYSEKN